MFLYYISQEPIPVPKLFPNLPVLCQAHNQISSLNTVRGMDICPLFFMLFCLRRSQGVLSCVWNYSGSPNYFSVGTWKRTELL